MRKLFALNKIKNEERYLGTGYKKSARGSLVAADFLSQGQSDFDNESRDLFQQDSNDSNLRKDRSMFVAADFGFEEYIEILLES